MTTEVIIYILLIKNLIYYTQVLASFNEDFIPFDRPCLLFIQKMVSLT